MKILWLCLLWNAKKNKVRIFIRSLYSVVSYERVCISKLKVCQKEQCKWLEILLCFLLQTQCKYSLSRRKFPVLFPFESLTRYTLSMWNEKKIYSIEETRFHFLITHHYFPSLLIWQTWSNFSNIYAYLIL